MRSIRNDGTGMHDVQARRGVALLLAAAALVLTACGAPARPSGTTTPDVNVERSVDYRTVDGTDLADLGVTVSRRVPVRRALRDTL